MPATDCISPIEHRWFALQLKLSCDAPDISSDGGYASSTRLRLLKVAAVVVTSVRRVVVRLPRAFPFSAPRNATALLASPSRIA